MPYKRADELGIPFGKYIDPSTIDGLELIKYEMSATEVEDQLYFLKDVKENDYYCCFEPDLPEDYDYHDSRIKKTMQRFLTSEIGENGKIELLRPKHDDWYITHYLARVYVPEK